MAYMGRGGFSSVGGSSLGGGLGSDDNLNKDNEKKGRIYYPGTYGGIHYYVTVDNTYVLFQIIATIIIFTIAGIAFLSIYKPAVIDPAENTKRILMSTYIVVTLVLLFFTLLANYFSKNKKALINKLILILSLSVVTILVFLGMKVNLDSIYTKNKFEQIYEQEYSGDNNYKINIGFTGAKISSEKEYYVEECVKAYNIFSIRMYAVIAINTLLIVLLIYQISKVSKIQEKRDRINKDDEILFDEEENVKI